MNDLLKQQKIFEEWLLEHGGGEQNIEKDGWGSYCEQLTRYQFASFQFAWQQQQDIIRSLEAKVAYHETLSKGAMVETSDFRERLCAAMDYKIGKVYPDDDVIIKDAVSRITKLTEQDKLLEVMEDALITAMNLLQLNYEHNLRHTKMETALAQYQSYKAGRE